MQQFINAWFSLAQTDFSLGLALFLTIVTGLLSIYLIVRFFKIFLRPGLKGYLSFLGTILGTIFLFIAIYYPQVIAAILPKPWSTLFWIAWVGFILYVVINWFIDRGKPKTILSMSSQTTSIRMRPNCIFCGKRGAQVLHHTVESNTEESGVKSYSKATYPFPAHSDCYQKSLDKDKHIDVIPVIGIILGSIAFVANILILLKSTLLPLDLRYSIQRVSALMPLLALIIPCILYGIGFKTQDTIKLYCKKNLQK